jgi:hypothetical protein
MARRWLLLLFLSGNTREVSEIYVLLIELELHLLLSSYYNIKTRERRRYETSHARTWMYASARHSVSQSVGAWVGE